MPKERERYVGKRFQLHDQTADYILDRRERRLAKPVLTAR
jgi:hypothetical protein